MAKPAVRIAAIQFGFAVGILAVLTRAAQLQIVEARALGAGGRAAADREGRAPRPARRALRPERRPARHHPGVLPRRRRAERARRRPRGVRAAGAEPRRVGAGARSGVPGAEALDLPARSVQRDPGAAASRQVHGIHLTGEFQRFYPVARPRPADHRRRSRPTGRSAPPGLELALDSLLTGPPGRGGAAQGPRGPPLRVARPADARPGRRATTSSSRSTRSCRRSPSGDWTMPSAQMKAEGGDVVFLDPNIGRAAGAGVAAGGGRRRAAAPRPSPIRSSPARPPSCSPRRRCCMHDRVDSRPTRCPARTASWHMPVTSSGRTRRITDAHAHARHADAGAGDPGVEQHRHGQVLLAARGPRSSSRCCATSASARRPGAEFPSRVARPPGAARPMAADVHPGEPGDGLRVRGDAGAARGGVRRHRQRRRAARADAGAGDPRPGGQTALPPPARSRCGGWSARRSRPQLREFLREAVGEGGTGEQAQLANYSVLGKTGTAVRFEDGRYVRGEYTASFAAIFPADHPQLVVIVKIDNPRGQLLRRTHRRAGDPDDAAAGAGLAPGRDRSRAASLRATRCPSADAGPDAAPRGPPPVVVTLPVPTPQPVDARAAAGARRRGPVRSARRRWRCTGAGSG